MAGRQTPAPAWTPEELAILDSLKSTEHVQAFLDETPYSTDPIYRCPRRVLRDRFAHCLDGALLAAAALRHLGYPPLIVDLRAVRDDDHVIAIFKRRGRLGAIAKSNMVGLRSREPIYKDLRELAMSYFDDYYNLEREKTLRSYSEPFDLSRHDRTGWMFRDAAISGLVKRLDDAPHRPLMTAAMVKALAPVDRRSYEAGLMGSNPAGLYGSKEHA